MLNIKKYLHRNKTALILLLIGIFLTISHGLRIGFAVANDPRMLLGDYYVEIKILVLDIAFILFSVIFAIIKLFTKPHGLAKIITLIILLAAAIFVVPVCSERTTGGLTGASSFRDKNVVRLITEGPYNRGQATYYY